MEQHHLRARGPVDTCHTFLINSHPAILDGFVSNYRVELEQLQANSDQAMSMGEMTM